jgi:thymidine kinase
MNGYLEIILGPMFSKKTTKLVEIYKKYIDYSMPIVINHSFDNKRYGDSSVMTTHDNVEIPCITTEKLIDAWNQIKEDDINKYDVILINEGQFYDDLVEAVKDMLSYNKIIYVCGLDGDFQRNKFGNILDLIPLCDCVTKQTAQCNVCKNENRKAIFTVRLTNDTEQTVIGYDNYIPVCRGCYEKSRKNPQPTK